MKILIVDDIETNRKLLRVNLEAEGIETLDATDGMNALAVLQSGRVDGIISDILMPLMDGYRFCQEVRKSKVFGDTPFIFYTSTYTSPSDERLAMNCGADCYLKKPAPIDVILEAIHGLSDPQRPRPSPAAIVAEESLVMREYNEVLVLKLEERNEKLEKARRGITAANEELEGRVEERTAELHLANQELEAFSQSIAHDLRSPLTAIAGFSYLLVEECRGKVSVRAMDHLRFISEAAGRMNDLTSDLLRLSRAHRAEMSLREIDLSALSTAVIQDLRAKQPERQIECVVERGMIVNAGLGLVRIALENLLSNAWKYTGKTQKPRIEFGVEHQGGTPAFFVRDNGAGFDMAAAGKLFGAFCRLHSATDFAGTGSGLSMVQRIVSRHGGRIWVKAAVDLGAAFYFTLGPAAQSKAP